MRQINFDSYMCYIDKENTPYPTEESYKFQHIALYG